MLLERCVGVVYVQILFEANSDGLCPVRPQCEVIKPYGKREFWWAVDSNSFYERHGDETGMSPFSKVRLLVAIEG